MFSSVLRANLFGNAFNLALLKECNTLGHSNYKHLTPNGVYEPSRRQRKYREHLRHNDQYETRFIKKL
jgi:hypothetical protein